MVRSYAMKNSQEIKVTTVRIPYQLWRWMDELANKNRRSFNSEVVLLIEAAHRAADAKTDLKSDLKKE